MELTSSSAVRTALAVVVGLVVGPSACGEEFVPGGAGGTANPEGGSITSSAGGAPTSSAGSGGSSTGSGGAGQGGSQGGAPAGSGGGIGGAAGSGGSAQGGGGASTVDASGTADVAKQDAAPDVASPMDSGRRDAAPEADVNTMPGDSACYGQFTNAIFCDGFERPGLGVWTPYFHDGTADRVTTNKLRGLAALHSLNTKPEGGGAVYADWPGLNSGSLSLRAHLYIPAYPLAGVSMLVLGESVQPLGGISVVLGDTGVMVQVNPPVTGYSAPFDLPRNKWICVQLDTTISPTNGSVRLRIDGQELVSKAGISTVMPSNFSRVWAGVNWSPPGQVGSPDVYVDEVVVDRAPIPCN